MDVREIYNKYVSKLSQQQRNELLDMMVGQSNDTGATAPHSLLELEGLGADVWAGVDAQEYVEDLRKEWDRRP
ncbi:MAG TPA: hypothetical protein VI756_29240 [Blastocatellia bacterium]